MFNIKRLVGHRPAFLYSQNLHLFNHNWQISLRPVGNDHDRAGSAEIAVGADPVGVVGDRVAGVDAKGGVVFAARSQGADRKADHVAHLCPAGVVDRPAG